MSVDYKETDFDEYRYVFLTVSVAQRMDWAFLLEAGPSWY